jgi:hypothetical protein
MARSNRCIRSMSDPLTVDIEESIHFLDSESPAGLTPCSLVINVVLIHHIEASTCDHHSPDSWYWKGTSGTQLLKPESVVSWSCSIVVALLLLSQFLRQELVWYPQFTCPIVVLLLEFLHVNLDLGMVWSYVGRRNGCCWDWNHSKVLVQPLNFLQSMLRNTGIFLLDKECLDPKTRLFFYYLSNTKVGQ